MVKTFNFQKENNGLKINYGHTKKLYSKKT